MSTPTGQDGAKYLKGAGWRVVYKGRLCAIAPKNQEAAERHYQRLLKGLVRPEPLNPDRLFFE